MEAASRSCGKRDLAFCGFLQGFACGEPPILPNFDQLGRKTVHLGEGRAAGADGRRTAKAGGRLLEAGEG